jgi:hypothetical protein
MPKLEDFRIMERVWDPANSTAVAEATGGTRRFTQVHVPSVEDRYILLAI